MVKKSHINSILLIAIDLCQLHYQNLVDNLSGVYDKECKKCMETKKN